MSTICWNFPGHHWSFIKPIKSINYSSWLHKNYYHAYSSPCDTPSNCNKTHEERDQKQHSEEVIWAGSLVDLVRRLVVVHQGNLYRDNERKSYFLVPSKTLSQTVQVVKGVLRCTHSRAFFMTNKLLVWKPTTPQNTYRNARDWELENMCKPDMCCALVAQCIGTSEKPITDLFNVEHQKKLHNAHCWHEGTKEGSNPARKKHCQDNIMVCCTSKTGCSQNKKPHFTIT